MNERYEYGDTTGYEFPNFTDVWAATRIPVWQKTLADLRGKPGINALEVGSWQFRSGYWFLRNLCSHPSSRLTCVDWWRNEESERRFDQHVAHTGLSHKVRKIKGESADVLPTLLERFDFAYVDASHEARDALLDGLLALRLLRVGGVLIFDDYGDPGTGGHHSVKAGVDAFLSLNDWCLEIIHQGFQVAVRRTR